MCHRVSSVAAFDRPRQRMVEEQLKARGISNPRILEVMGDIPRHVFVDAALASRAYYDSALPIGEGQTISQPYMVGKMTELLNLEGRERVLEIGTGCGYQTAVLSRLCRRVYSIERMPSLAARARSNLRTARHANVMLKCADGTEGWEEYAPYDAILAAAGSDHVPDIWIQQLREGGSLLMPLGTNGSHTLTRITKHASSCSQELFDACCFVPLISGHDIAQASR